MLKRSLLLSLTLALFTISFSQKKYGFKAGVTHSFIKESLANPDQNTDLKTGFQVGAMADITLLKNLSIRPALQFTQKGYKAIEGNIEGPYYWKRQGSLFYLEIPVDLVYNVSINQATKLFIGAGPVLSVGLFGNLKGASRITDDSGQIHTQEDSGVNPFNELGSGFTKSIYKRTDLGADFLIGIAYKKFIATTNYDHSLRNIVNYDPVSSVKNRSFAFTIGYFISKQ